MKIWIYKHYKWNLYEVLYFAKNAQNLEDFVVYKALYNSHEFWNNAVWVRPKSIFTQKININWELIPRFKYVWNETYKNI